MKAWKETWTAQRYVIEMAGRQLGQFVDDLDDPEWSWCDRERAELAALAPEMARLIFDACCSRNCDWCYQKIDRSRSDAGGFYVHTHSKACEGVAILRRIGLTDEDMAHGYAVADKETR
jgi:hypothetical protein